MSSKIINHEQSEYWNKKYGHKWVDNDNSMNERLTILTKALFLKTNINSALYHCVPSQTIKRYVC